MLYLLIPLPSPSVSQIKSIEKLFFSFIWNEKPDRIKRNITVKNYAEGGLKMINVAAFIKKLKLSWMKRFLFEQKSLNDITTEYLNHEMLVNCGTEYTFKIANSLSNDFWKEVLIIWGEFCEIIEKDIQEVAQIPIFFNKNIKINNKCIFYKSWASKHVYLLNDLIDSNGNFLTYDEFRALYDIGTIFF